MASPGQRRPVTPSLAPTEVQLSSWHPKNGSREGLLGPEGRRPRPQLLSVTRGTRGRGWGRNAGAPGHTRSPSQPRQPRQPRVAQPLMASLSLVLEVFR